MAKKLKVGDTLHGYRITKVFGPGMMAISYDAQGRSGQKVFLKQYKSPAPTVVWYKKFVAYQHELAERVRTTRASHFAVRQVDAFEEEWGGRCYFQVYEFVENGFDLQHLLDEERDQHFKSKRAPASTPTVWARHLTWAKVLVSGVASLHEARIVHADLKPANAYLITDPSIGSGFQLKLIDMDFSLLADQRAPWHGFQGYVGTDNYRSPEHLVRGSVPGPASDVFTTGLILYELLAGYHPYWNEDQAAYARHAQSHAAKIPKLIGPLPSPANATAVASALHHCLSPNPSERPSADELGAVLKGRGTQLEAWAVNSSVTLNRDGVSDRTRSVSAQPIISRRLELSTPGGRSMEIGVRTELGKLVVKMFGSDSEFWDAKQCLLDRDELNRWVVIPISGTPNETLLNGEALTGPRPLKAGDQLAVGRQAKGIVKLPITVRGV